MTGIGYDRIGYDLDGVITVLSLLSKRNTKLPWWCGLWLAVVPPNRKIIKELRSHHKNGRTVVIVSARHKQLKGITGLYLRVFRLSFVSVVCVGPGKDVPKKKLEAIQELKLERFIDDDDQTVVFLRNAGIEAFHYKRASC